MRDKIVENICHKLLTIIGDFAYLEMSCALKMHDVSHNLD